MARAWQIAIVGTFDVENYGDLLFPIIAEAELSRRLGAVTMHRFSYHDRTPPAWPYAVTSLADLPQCSQQLDGLLVGGGFILRFDKVVAHGYGPPSPDIHHPTGYWLTPALLAIEQGIPVIWNAPGMHCNEVPAWAAPLLRLALANSACIRVRDALTQETLARVATDAHISVLPDTAFGLPRLLDPQQPSAEFTRIAAAAGLGDRYLVIHAIAGLEPFLRLIRQYPQQFSDYQLLLLPIGPVLGDHAAVLGDELPRAVQLPSWPAPMLLAELIANAQAVVGHSYHLAITAIAFGVPAFCSADLGVGKYTALAAFESVFPLPADDEPDPRWILDRIGRKSPSAAAQQAAGQLVEYWDEVADVLRAGRSATPPAFPRFWQDLPNWLESAVDRQETLADDHAHREQALLADLAHAHAQLTASAAALDETGHRLALMTAAKDEAEHQLALQRAAEAARITARLRALLRGLRKPVENDER